MKRNTLETPQKRKFFSPVIEIFICKPGTRFLAASATLENIEEIDDYFSDGE